MRSFRIARVLGVDVIGDPSLLVLGVLLSWVIYLELRLPQTGASQSGALVGAVIGGVVFLGTVLAHEVSHTAVAQRRGHTVKQIRLMIFGGASELEDKEMTPQTELVVAIVGPVTSAVLGGAFVLLSVAFSGSAAVAGGSRFVGLANLALAVFNLLPGLPLDGGRVVRAIWWLRTGDRDRATRMALQSGRLVGLALVGVGAYLTLRGNVGLGVWVLFVGWFLTRMAAQSTRAHQLEMVTRDRSVADLMRPVSESVPGSLSVADAIELHQIGPSMRPGVVEVDGRVVGIFGQAEIDAVGPVWRAATNVVSAMTRIGPADVVDVSTPLIEALQREAGGTRLIVATENGRVVGLIGHTEIGELLRFNRVDS